MGDRSRTFDQLKQQLFGQNVTGDDLFEQSIRDLIESMFQFGGISLPAGTFVPNPGQVIGTNFICVDQWNFLAPSTSDVQPNLDGTITILRPGTYVVKASLSFSGSNNSDWTGSVFRNDINMDICTFRELLRPAGDVSSAGAFDPVLVNANDILEYRVKSGVSGKTFLLESGQFFVFKIG